MRNQAFRLYTMTHPKNPQILQSIQIFTRLKFVIIRCFFSEKADYPLLSRPPTDGVHTILENLAGNPVQIAVDTELLDSRPAKLIAEMQQR